MIEQLMFFGQLAEIGLLFKIAYSLGALTEQIKEIDRRVNLIEKNA